MIYICIYIYRYRYRYRYIYIYIYIYIYNGILGALTYQKPLKDVSCFALSSMLQ